MEKSEVISKTSMKVLVFQYFMILISAFAVAVFMHSTWVKQIHIYHTVLELFCVFIALAIFISIWYTYYRNSENNHVLCFGYFIIAVFDALHSFYHLKLDLSVNSYFDLSTKFWLLSRICDAVVLFMASKTLKVKLNKRISMIITLLITLGIFGAVINYWGYLPPLMTDNGVTPLKVALEYLVICIYFLGLYGFRNKINDNGSIAYRYIFISILLSIPAEISFTLFSSIYSISWTIGHLLKIASYYLLFKGIFISTINYPYVKLEVEHRKLEKSNEELNHIGEALNDILDALPVAVQKYDVDGKLNYVNKKFEELLGYDRKALYGLTNEELNKQFERNEEVSKYNINTYKTMKGELIKLSTNAHNIRNGKLVILNETIKEQQLEKLHIQTDTILNSVTNGILMIDNNNKIILCNRAIEEILEVDRERILGIGLYELNFQVNPEAGEHVNHLLESGAGGNSFELTLTSFKGNRRELQIHATHIPNIKGEAMGTIFVGTDITELRKEQQKMMQQEKLALLGQMGAGIVHETRNYLTTIKGRCQLISAIVENEEIKKHAVKINSEVDEVNRIISEFLFLAKPRDTELEEVSLFDIFESIKSMVETASLVKGVDVSFLLSKEERYTLCDEAQLKQVILNVTKNAVDAMTDKKDARLEVETGYNEASNEMFIRITDNGKGISEEDLKRIGTPFFTTKSNGTGLGLNACFKIIENHKGRIEVQSRLDEGTSFTVILPCISDDELDDVI